MATSKMHKNFIKSYIAYLTISITTAQFPICIYRVCKIDIAFLYAMNTKLNACICAYEDCQWEDHDHLQGWNRVSQSRNGKIQRHFGIIQIVVTPQLAQSCNTIRCGQQQQWHYGRENYARDTIGHHILINESTIMISMLKWSN